MMFKADKHLEGVPDDVVQISDDESVESDDEEDALEVNGGKENQGLGLTSTALVIMGTGAPGMEGR